MTFTPQINSTSSIDFCSPHYITSESIVDIWGGQLPISRQAFLPSQPDLIDGIYVSAEPPKIILPIEPALAQEFAAWEAASNEALERFESGLE